jgi:hypothetical protein
MRRVNRATATTITYQQSIRAHRLRIGGNIRTIPSGMISDRRKATDRRREILASPNDRRVRPDRRLNNISVEWIPFNEINNHPTTRDAFCSSRRNKGNAVKLHKTDTGPKEPPRQTRSGQAQIRFWGLDIFKRTQEADVEQRSMTDRRTKNIKQPFDRRVRPDRRLNNISLEWITFE